MDMEAEDPCNPIVTDPVLCIGTRPSGVCRVCGSRGGCSCWWPDNWGDHSGSGGGNQGGGTTAPDYNDGGNTGGGGGGGNGSNPSTSGTPSVSTMFNAEGLTESQKTEINNILSKLSDIGISNKVLKGLMEKGKITLKTGTVSGHDQSFAVYALQTNTLTINMTQIESSTDKAANLRNAVMEETFHAYQYRTYGNQFNQRCYEFEAKVYGTIVINQLGGPASYLNPMDKEGLGDVYGQNYFNDVNYSGNFTHGISSQDMQILYQNYGNYCTQYPPGDPNWIFKALPGL
ncbi:hypothetical protein [Rikenella microfusus]